MDSLLIVLIVIGVVMILGGIARMRSKRRHGWDEIDHSVLFSKNEPEDEVISAARPVGSARVTAEDVDHSPAVEGLDSIVADERDDRLGAEPELPSITLDADDQRDEHISRAAAPSNRARSILSKLRGDNARAEAEAASDDDSPTQKSYKSGAPDKVIVINVMATHGRQFAGSTLVDAIQASGMSFGDMQIFHYQADNASLFSLVNMVQPGQFDLSTMADLKTPGVSLFVQMPIPQGKGLDAFDTMLATAQQLAQTLGGELRDETRSVLTHSAIDLIRQQIAEYDCKWLAQPELAY